MVLAKLFAALFFGIVVTIKPTAILFKRSWMKKSNEIEQEDHYNKSTLRLWRVAGIAFTIIAAFFILKEFKVL